MLHEVVPSESEDTYDHENSVGEQKQFNLGHLRVNLVLDVKIAFDYTIEEHSKDEVALEHAIEIVLAVDAADITNEHRFVKVCCDCEYHTPNVLDCAEEPLQAHN